jgi:sugar phosphate isomerase/epimerase
MHAKFERREFLKVGSAMAAASAQGVSARASAATAKKVTCSSPSAAKIGWRVGIAQYTFRRYSLFEMLDLLVQLGVECIETGFFLPLDKARPDLQTNQNLSPAVRKELKQRLADRGLSMSGFYADLGADRDQARRIFEFTNEMGAGTIIAEPPAEAFDMIEKLCDEYAIDVAIHNHPESPQSKYWRPENVLAVCKGRGKRIGACCDTGHWVRSGLDPVECLRKLEGRILGFHLKDAAEKGNRQSRDVPLGEGQANYAAVLRELKRQGYRGVTAIEYEHDSPELMADVAKCVAFVEKTARELA